LQEFIEHLSKGEFRIPICKSCASKVWPPSPHCPYCLSKTSLEKIEKTGILLEFTSSFLEGKEGVFGLVDMSGIKLIGSFGTKRLKEGMKVRMKGCGVKPDGTTFYSFTPAMS
jgi:uncharacterized OB-fold protein